MKLIVSNKLTIQETEPEILEYLKALLTIPNPKWESAQAFKRSVRGIPKNLIQYEIKGKSLEIPRGLLEHVLEDLGYQFDVEDSTVAPACEPWPESKVTLREKDQRPAVAEILKHPNCFLSAPAGSGKTVMGLEICRRLGLRTLWLVHQGHLMDQAISEAENLFGIPREEIGILQGKNWSVGDRLTVGMIPTMRKRDLSDLTKEFGLIIIDEAHHVPCESFIHVLSHFHASKIYGLTATAYRNDGLENLMFNAVGPIKHRLEHEDLFENEHLIKPEICIRRTGWCPLNKEMLEYHELLEKMTEDRQRNALIVKDVVHACEAGGPFIVLVERTKHAEILTEMIKGEGIKCEFVVGSLDVETSGVQRRGRRKPKRKKKIVPKKVREKVVSDFKAGKLQGIVATYDLLAEGFNYKPLRFLFLGSPVQYSGIVTQAVGRVQRPCEGKEDATVVDYLDDLIHTFERHGNTRIREVYQRMEMPIRMLE